MRQILENKINPVLRREMLESLRSWKSFLAITLYFSLMAAIIVLMLQTQLGYSNWGGFDPEFSSVIYIVISAVQMVLIFIIVPAITASAISGEIERQTLDLLLVTKMSPISIIRGKLMSSILTMLLFILATLPVYSMILFFGGLSVLDIFLMTIYSLFMTLFVACITMLFSCMFKKTGHVMIASYIVLLSITIGELFLILIVSQIIYGDYEFLMAISCIINPIFAFMSVMDSQINKFFINNSLSDQFKLFEYVKPWLCHVILDTVIIFLLMKISAKKIEPMK